MQLCYYSSQILSKSRVKRETLGSAKLSCPVHSQEEFGLLKQATSSLGERQTDSWADFSRYFYISLYIRIFPLNTLKKLFEQQLLCQCSQSCRDVSSPPCLYSVKHNADWCVSGTINVLWHFQDKSTFLVMWQKLCLKSTGPSLAHWNISFTSGLARLI